MKDNIVVQIVKKIQLFSLFLALASAAQTEYGNLIGRFEDRETIHLVEGTVYAVDEHTFYVRGFSYDGEGPDAFFYVGTTDRPAVGGVIIPLQGGVNDKLRTYENEDVTFTIPNGRRIKDYKWLSVWCRNVIVNFGDVTIGGDLVVPSPVSLGSFGFSRRVHNVHADNVIVLNDRQFEFINLDYDGTGPDAHFWTGSGTPDSSDTMVPYPYLNDPVVKLPRFDGDTVRVTLPDGFTARSIDFIGMWCILARQDFGHTILRNRNLENIPPYISTMATEVEPAVPPTEEDNCLVLQPGRFHIAWSLDRPANRITLEFRGIIATDEYLAFGISGSNTRTSMVGSDVTVVWVDGSDIVKAEDYYLNDYSQCIPEEGRGACPDLLQGGTNDVVLLGGSVTEGVAVITVERPLNPSDVNDKAIPTSGDSYISWGIGFINPTGHTAKHDTRTNGDLTLDFGQASSKCQESLGETTTRPVNRDPWNIEPLRPQGNATFTALIGPSGGQRGYQGIAQQVGWGLAWYINGRMIPEIHVERGNTYTFEIFGGDDPDSLGSYHPFYITDDRDGGYAQKTEDEKALERIIVPPVEGPLCEYKVGDYEPDSFNSFLAYRATLELGCDYPPQSPGILKWTVADDTPDVVYYQCYQHRFFGWKIHVSDSASASSTISVNNDVTDSAPASSTIPVNNDVTDSAPALSTISVMSMTLISCLAMVLARLI